MSSIKWSKVGIVRFIVNLCVELRVGYKDPLLFSPSVNLLGISILWTLTLTNPIWSLGYARN